MQKVALLVIVNSLEINSLFYLGKLCKKIFV